MCTASSRCEHSNVHDGFVCEVSCDSTRQVWQQSKALDLFGTGTTTGGLIVHVVFVQFCLFAPAASSLYKGTEGIWFSCRLSRRTLLCVVTPEKSFFCINP